MAVSVAVNGGGDAVVYQTSSGVDFDLLDSSLAPTQLDVQVSATASSWIDATTRDGGGFTVEWLSNGAIMAEDFSASGASLGSAYAWSGSAPALAPLAFTSNASGSTAVLPTGGTVVSSLETVQNQYQLHVQQYDATGKADAAAFTLTAQPISMFGGANIAALADGSYVAEYAVDGNYSASLYLERFSADGSPLGQIAVAHYGGMVSLEPSNYSVAGLADGGFVASWTIANGASSTPEAYVEEFTASGTGLGVVDLGHAGSAAPVIDSLADGHFVISWTSDAGSAQHRVFTEGSAALGAQDPAAPAGSTSAAVQTSPTMMSVATTTVSHSSDATAASGNQSATHASDPATGSSLHDAHDALLSFHSLHATHGAASLVWYA